MIKTFCARLIIWIVLHRVIEKNVIGFQFHPEKSHDKGLQILKNFHKIFMLKKRVIPTLLLKNKRMVKGKNFSNYRDVGAISAVKIYNNQHADELMFIDINEEKDFKFLLSTLEKVSKNCFIPLCAGGGISSIDQVKDLLEQVQTSFNHPNIIKKILFLNLQNLVINVL